MEERGSFCFDDPNLSITWTHVMGGKPLGETYRPHTSDSGEIDQAGASSFAECKNRTTRRADYIFLPTVSRGAAATIVAGFALLSMAREAMWGLWA